MKKLVYPAILWLVCLLFGSQPLALGFISATLFSLSTVSIGLYLPTRFCWLFCLAFEAVAAVWPPLMTFLPLCAYLLHSSELSRGRRSIRSFLWFLPFLIALPETQTLITLVVLCILAMLLAHNALVLEQQERRFYALQDNAVETARSLEQKNKALLEKQDYQVQLATLTERGRLAREIHDNVGHLLTRALFQVSALQVMQPENKEALGMVKTTLEDAMTNIRASVHDLHDEALDLRMELQKLIDAFPACPVTLRYHCQPVPAPVHYCFIAVVKEALSNIARHSNATSASVSVLEHPALYQLIIEDNGTKDSAAAKSSPAEKNSSAGFSNRSRMRTVGIGLQNIQDRVTALQGNFVIHSDKGFRIFISVPKTEKEAPYENRHYR